MARYFEALLRTDDPGVSELALFVQETQALLAAMLEDQVFMERACRRDERIIRLARKSFGTDVHPALGAVHSVLVATAESIERSPDSSGSLLYARLVEHGLVGVSAAFKYSVLERVVRAWRSRDGHLTAGAGFRAAVEAIDAILDSVAAAIPGAGIAKEFKDALLAIAPIRAGG